MAERLANLPQTLRHSVTFDNGSEFAKYRRLTENLGLAVYFAEPYKAWQRGANENANGLLAILPQRNRLQTRHPRRSSTRQKTTQ